MLIGENVFQKPLSIGFVHDKHAVLMKLKRQISAAKIFRLHAVRRCESGAANCDTVEDKN